MDLTQVSKQDTKWRVLANTFTNDPSLADDLVQEMYLILHTWKAPICEYDIRFLLNELHFESKIKEEVFKHPANLFFLEDTTQPTEQDYTELEITLLS